MDKSSIKILLVEDHEITQRVIKMILIEKGVKVDIASTGAEALEFFQKNEYELILIDIGLPDMSGLDIAEHMKHATREMPIIILSAYSDPSYQERAKFMGLEDYIIKPFTKEQCENLLIRFFPNFEKSVEVKEPYKLGNYQTKDNPISDIHFDLQTMNDVHCIRLNDFDVCYNNELIAREIYDEVFVKKIYEFKTSKKCPIIIDAGSNIGISMLYFKMNYPLSKILCFEPDKNAFEILQKNVIVNKLNDVILINAALSKKEGMIPFFGEVYGLETDTRGNSIVEEWGSQRDTCAQILVNSTCLSNYINEEIDFLKMDIEGAEQEVLEELGDKLNLVNKIVIEVHETEMININNNLKQICQILEKYRFKITVKSQDIIKYLPKQVSGWIKKVHPKFNLIRGEKI